MFPSLALLFCPTQTLNPFNSCMIQTHISPQCKVSYQHQSSFYGDILEHFKNTRDRKPFGDIITTVQLGLMDLVSIRFQFAVPQSCILMDSHLWTEILISGPTALFPSIIIFPSPTLQLLRSQAAIISYQRKQPRQCLNIGK